MKLLPLAATLLLLAPLTLATADDVHARNVAFFWSLVGEVDASTPATMHDGRVVTLADAIDEAAARAGEVDLAALATGATPAVGPGLGYFWITEFGLGPCTMNYVPGVPFYFGVDPQTAIPGGGVGTMSTTNGWGYMIDWTLKQTTFSPGNGFSAVGASDFFCFTFAGSHIAVPGVFGEAHWN